MKAQGGGRTTIEALSGQLRMHLSAACFIWYALIDPEHQQHHKYRPHPQHKVCLLCLYSFTLRREGARPGAWSGRCDNTQCMWGNRHRGYFLYTHASLHRSLGLAVSTESFAPHMNIVNSRDSTICTSLVHRPCTNECQCSPQRC